MRYRKPCRKAGRTSIAVVAACSLALISLTSSARGQDDTDVAIGQTAEHEVRFTSGKTVYVEALAGDQWVGRGWNAEGRTDLSTRRTAEPGFIIALKDSPTAKETRLLSGWQWVSATELAKTDRGARHFVVELSNKLAPVGVKMHTLLDGTAVLTRWLQITNNGTKPLAITEVAPWAGRLWDKDVPITLGCSVFQHDQRTGSFAWRPLPPGVTAIQNATEPCYDDPYFILRNETNGEYFFGQLAWPSIYRMEFNQQEGLTFRIGPIAPEGSVQRVVAAGETIETPAVHLCHIKADFDATVQAMHEHVRRSVLPRRNPDLAYRIEYQANGDTGVCLFKGADFNEKNLAPCIDVAAAVGAEAFVINGPQWATTSNDPLDRGQAGPGDPAGNGTIPQGHMAGWHWMESYEKTFPNGMRAFSDQVHQRGLLFGLYARTEGRNLLASNGGRMSKSIHDMVDKYGLDIFLHDTDFNQWVGWVNATVSPRDGFKECNLWRHHEVLYRTIEDVCRKYPKLLLWQAHGGGARSDLATVARWHENFQSDITLIPLAYQMANGFSVYLPPETMSTPLIGMGHGSGGDVTTDQTTLKRCCYTLGNAANIYWTALPAKVTDIKPAELREWRRYAELYKTFIRPLLPTCKVYHHAPINANSNWDSGSWFAMEYMSPDRTKGWATLIKYPGGGLQTYHLRPKGLDAQRNYAITFDNTGKTVVLKGSDVMRDGIDISANAACASELLLLEAR
jgi:alpha-galactosidase